MWVCVWTWLYAFEGDDKATKSQEAKQKYEKPLLHVNQNHTQKGVFFVFVLYDVDAGWFQNVVVLVFFFFNFADDI